MINSELVSYIRSQIEKGLPIDIIKSNLRLGGGWTESDLAEAFATLPPVAASHPVAAPIPVIAQTPVQVVPSQPVVVPAPFQSSPVVSSAAPIVHIPSVQVIPIVSVQPQFVPQTASPQGQATSVYSMPSGIDLSERHSRISKKTVAIVCVGLIVLILSGGGLLYAAMTGLFTGAPHTEENFMTSLFQRSGSITSSTYTAAISASTAPRDADAKPFEIEVTDQAERNKQYANDVQRSGDLSSLFYTLKYKTPVPASLTEALKDSNYSSGVSTKDPQTGREYQYVATQGGTNFALTITFETKEAIKAVTGGYGYVATTTIVRGQTVTYTKDSYPSYLSSTLPKPFLVELQDNAAYAPSEFKAIGSITAAADFNTSDFKFNVNAAGDFGDLSYKVNVDLLSKDKTYYLRINNIPSIFLGSLSIEKGEWIKLTSGTSTAFSGSSYDPVSILTNQLPEVEGKYKEDKAKFIQLLSAAAKIADEQKLVMFKNAPIKETVDGRKLYRYDLTFKKQSIVAFYKALQTEVSKGDYGQSASFLNDPALLEYLQSPQFDQIFEYYNTNTTLTIWVDKDGYPAQIEYGMRIVPPDTADQLKTKQVNVSFKLIMTDINLPTPIVAPETSKDLSEIMKGSLGSALNKGKNASIMANLASIRTQAELYFDSHKNAYGAAVSKGSCSIKNTVFTDAAVALNIQSAIDSAKAGNVSEATAICYGNANAWALSVPLIPEDSVNSFWCVDSTGASKKTTTTLTGTSCGY